MIKRTLGLVVLLTSFSNPLFNFTCRYFARQVVFSPVSV